MTRGCEKCNCNEMDRDSHSFPSTCSLGSESGGRKPREDASRLRVRPLLVRSSLSVSSSVACARGQQEERPIRQRYQGRSSMTLPPRSPVPPAALRAYRQQVRPSSSSSSSSSSSHQPQQQQQQQRRPRQRWRRQRQKKKDSYHVCSAPNSTPDRADHQLRAAEAEQRSGREAHRFPTSSQQCLHQERGAEASQKHPDAGIGAYSAGLFCLLLPLPYYVANATPAGRDRLR
jgi:hypothetical protein